MTLQQDLGVGWGWGGFPLFPEMEFCLLCFSLFHRIVEIDLLDGESFIIWWYLYIALYTDYSVITTLSLIGENIQQLYLK